MNLSDVNVIRGGGLEPVAQARSRKGSPSIVAPMERPPKRSLAERVEIGCVDWYIYPESMPVARKPAGR